MRKNTVNQSIVILGQITGIRCDRDLVRSESFSEFLTDFKFETAEDLDRSLRAYCDIVLTHDVSNAIFIQLPDDPPIKTLKLQYSICRAEKRSPHLLDQFLDHSDAPLPKWYVAARKRMNVKRIRQT